MSSWLTYSISLSTLPLKEAFKIPFVAICVHFVDCVQLDFLFFITSFKYGFSCLSRTSVFMILSLQLFPIMWLLTLIFTHSVVFSSILQNSCFPVCIFSLYTYRIVFTSVRAFFSFFSYQ